MCSAHELILDNGRSVWLGCCGCAFHLQHDIDLIKLSISQGHKGLRFYYMPLMGSTSFSTYRCWNNWMKLDYLWYGKCLYLKCILERVTLYICKASKSPDDVQTWSSQYINHDNGHVENDETPCMQCATVMYLNLHPCLCNSYGTCVLNLTVSSTYMYYNSYISGLFYGIGHINITWCTWK